MKKNEMKKEDKVNYLPTYKEIPAVGLYLDQTSKYINDVLNALPNCTITNSMIANYVKKHLIDHPVKKQYNRDQIAYLLFIVLTKSAISLEDADRLFGLQKEKYALKEAYEYFRRRFDQAMNEDHFFSESEEELLILTDNIILTVVSNIRLHELLEKTLYRDGE